MTHQIEAASRALRDAARRSPTVAALVPALADCPNCGTVRMIASAARACGACGAELDMLAAPRAAADGLTVAAPLELASVA